MKNCIGVLGYVVWLFILLNGCSINNPPSQEQIDICTKTVTHWDSIQKTDELTVELANEKIQKEIEALQLNNLTLEQVKQISKDGMLYRYNSLRLVIKPSLQKLSKEPTFDGCVAASILTVNYPKPVSEEDNPDWQMEWVDAYRDFVTHPAIEELMLAETGYYSRSVFGRLQFLDPEVVGKSSLIDDMIPLLKKTMSPECCASTVTLFDVARNPRTGLSENKVQEIRKMALEKNKEALDIALQSSKKNSERTIERLKHLIAYLSGAFAKGVLIDHKAPEIHFNWISIPEVKLLSELKGNVIVIDFWATWCSPCISSFPNIRALQERYMNYPVKIIGVTSLQGYHVDRKNKSRINTKGNPDMEYQLMKQFMKDMEITWDIAFSEEPEFNEEYGVRGIPHVAIIDSEGIVRYNMLRPYEAPYHEAEKIDQLLKEAGLKYPERPMEKTNYSNVDH